MCHQAFNDWGHPFPGLCHCPLAAPHAADVLAFVPGYATWTCPDDVVSAVIVLVGGDGPGGEPGQTTFQQAVLQPGSVYRLFVAPGGSASIRPLVAPRHPPAPGYAGTIY